MWSVAVSKLVIQKQFVTGLRNREGISVCGSTPDGATWLAVHKPFPSRSHIQPTVVADQRLVNQLSATFRLFFSLQPSKTVIYATLQFHSAVEICNRRGSQSKTEGLFMAYRVNFPTESCGCSGRQPFFVFRCYRLRGINYCHARLSLP